MSKILNRVALRKAMATVLTEDEHVLLLGEDIGVYGGSFQVTSFLYKKYPRQVIELPISESGFTGAAIGMALNGYKPILEYMFMDFSTQGIDQILNQAVKMNGMYNGQVTVPIMFRTPAGGYRNYGPTHSQSLENIFASIPNLEIVYPYSTQDYYSLFVYLVRNLKSPVLFIENKMLYLNKEDINTDLVYAPMPKLLQQGTDDVLILSYGYAIDLVKQAEESVSGSWSIINLNSLKPIRGLDFILEYVKRHKHVFIITESPAYASIAEHLSYTIINKLFSVLDNPIKIITSDDSFIPARKDKEEKCLLSVEQIRREILSCL